MAVRRIVNRWHLEIQNGQKINLKKRRKLPSKMLYLNRRSQFTLYILVIK